MAASRINAARRLLPETVRRRLEVATAMAWESIVNTHIVNARQFVQLLSGRLTLEDALARYMREMDLSPAIATAVNSRVLGEFEEPAEGESAAIELGGDAEDGDDGAEGWRRFRPDVVVRGVLERRRTSDETEKWVELLIARAEEGLIRTHVENAITFAALLEPYTSFARGVGFYTDAVALTGGRAQAVFQRTMARLADAHLPLPAPRTPQTSRATS
jgi:hypothetical protein